MSEELWVGVAQGFCTYIIRERLNPIDYEMLTVDWGAACLSHKYLFMLSCHQCSDIATRNALASLSAQAGEVI
jgi:hypothetical protein